MIKNIAICDRCGEECKGTTYYTVDIYGHDINPTDSLRQSMATASQNANTNTSKMFGRERCYCEPCKDKIKEFLSTELIPQPPKEPQLRILKEGFGDRGRKGKIEKIISKIAFHKWFKENG